MSYICAVDYMVSTTSLLSFFNWESMTETRLGQARLCATQWGPKLKISKRFAYALRNHLFLKGEGVKKWSNLPTGVEKLCNICQRPWSLMPYPCSHFYFDINFGRQIIFKREEARLSSEVRAEVSYVFFYLTYVMFGKFSFCFRKASVPLNQ